MDTVTRILLISDTHGHLSIINELAEQLDVQAVIHAGDFGFYDRDSVDRLSSRELRLHVRHSKLPPQERSRAGKLFEQELREFVRDHLPLSELPLFLENERRFAVPVFAVWGNHEDSSVVARFWNEEYKVDNLYILDENQNHRFGRLHIFGLGGNVIPGTKLFDRPIAGRQGKIWSTLSQMERLRQTIGRGPRQGEIRILVTHISPGKEPLIYRLAAHTRADFAISGHMNAPYSTVWNEFSVRDLHDSVAMIESQRKMIEVAWKKRRPHLESERERQLTEMGMKMVQELPPDRVHGGRRGAVP